jgi:hypothetical protein
MGDMLDGEGNIFDGDEELVYEGNVGREGVVLICYPEVLFF